MGTRSGSLDPAVVECIANNEHMTVTETLNVLNKKSGLLGISGASSDMRDVNKAAEEGNKDAQLALDMWAYGIRKYIGAYAAAMGGIDALIFTGRHRRKRRRRPRQGVRGSVLLRHRDRRSEEQGSRRRSLHLQGRRARSSLGYSHQRGAGHRAGYAGAHRGQIKTSRTKALKEITLQNHFVRVYYKGCSGGIPFLCWTYPRRSSIPGRFTARNVLHL